MQEMTPCEGPVHYNKWFNNLESLATIVKSAKSKDKMLRNYPLDPIGQNLLSKCGRLKAWKPNAFSNQNDPVILWDFLIHHI